MTLATGRFHMAEKGKSLNWSRLKKRLSPSAAATGKPKKNNPAPTHISYEDIEQNRLGKLHRRSIFFELLLLAAVITLGLGLTLPVVELSWLLVWKKTHSIIDVILTLYKEQEIFLAVVLFFFSVLFPVIKLFYLLYAYIQHIWYSRPQGLTLRHLHWLGKWSMLDVMVLALVVFYVKQSGVADAKTLPAIYYFGAAVILTMLATSRCEQHVRPL